MEYANIIDLDYFKQKINCRISAAIEVFIGMSTRLSGTILPALDYHDLYQSVAGKPALHPWLSETMPNKISPIIQNCKHLMLKRIRN